MDDSWDVEAVVQYRTYYRKEQWLIKWQGYATLMGAQGASAGGVGAEASSKRLWSTTSARGAGSDLSRGLCMEVPCEGARAWRRYRPRSRALLTPRRRRRPFYSMGFARSAGALDIICAAREASGSGVWSRLTRGRAQACVAWRRRAGAGREYRGAPGSARCLRSVGALERL